MRVHSSTLYCDVFPIWTRLFVGLTDCPLCGLESKRRHSSGYGGSSNGLPVHWKQSLWKLPTSSEREREGGGGPTTAMKRTDYVDNFSGTQTVWASFEDVSVNRIQQTGTYWDEIKRYFECGKLWMSGNDSKMHSRKNWQQIILKPENACKHHSEQNIVFPFVLRSQKLNFEYCLYWCWTFSRLWGRINVEVYISVSQVCDHEEY
jgi:hypothetical protein